MTSAALSVIVPAHNEEERIEATLRDLRAALPHAKLIVVVNDSFDRTLAIVRSLAANDKNLTSIDVPARVGKGGAVRIGFGLADRPYVAFVDADGATSGYELARLAALLERCDCVVASRWIDGAHVLVEQSSFRRLLGRGFNTCVRVLFGLRLWDTQCGAKLFRRETLLEILDDVDTADFAFDVDLLYAAHRRGHRILEVPTVWRERTGSKVNVRSAVPRMFLSLVRLRLRHSFFRIVLPLFDRYLRLAPIRSRRSLRYLVLAPSNGRGAAATPLEREMRQLLDHLASGMCDVTWYAIDAHRSGIRGPRWVHAMVAYLRSFRDRFDCVIEVLPGRESFLTPLYCLKPKIVVRRSAAPLPPFYSAALVMSGNTPGRREFEDALMLAMTRAGTHLYIDRSGHLVLSECLSQQTVRGLLLADRDALV